MRRVDCPNVKCRCASSLWFSYVIALLFSNGFLPPGTTCLAHCKLRCFCVGLFFRLYAKEKQSDGDSCCFASWIFSFPPSWMSKTAKLIAPLLLLSIQSTCRLLPTSELSGILVLPCLWDKQGCLETIHGSCGRHLTKNIGQERPVQNFSKLRS